MTRLTDDQEPVMRQHDDGTIEILNRAECAQVFPCTVEALDLMVADHNAKCAEVDALRAERDAAVERFDTAWADMRRIVAAGPEAERDAAVARAEQAEARIAAALVLCDEWQKPGMTNHPSTDYAINEVRRALSGEETP